MRLLLLLLLALPASAQVTGLSYTAAPVGVRFFAGDNTGLTNGYFYGGALGVGFGEYLEVSGSYLVGSGFETDFSQYGTDEDTRAQLTGLANGFDIDLERYGTLLRLTLGRGSLLPFAVAGTGIMRFDNGAETSEAIYAEAGAGITFAFQDRYTITVEGTRLGYRYNPYTTFDLGTLASLPPSSALNDVRTVYSNAVTATARVYLGGRARGELTDVDRAVQEQLRRPRVFAEPSYGLIQFDEELTGFPDEQPFAGAQAGIDLGPYVGLRGFYLRATDEDGALEGNPFDFRDMQMYGAELNLRFTTELASGVTPYLIVGGGFLDIGEDYTAGGELFDAPESRYFALGGGGVDVTLSRALRLKAGLRALLMSNEDADRVSDPSNVYTSLMPTVGVEFSLGGGAPARATRQRLADADAAERERLEAEAEALRLEREAEAIRLAAGADDTDIDLLVDPERSAEIVRYRAQIDSLRLAQGLPAAAPARSNLSGREMTVPIPETGEIYIRFGPLDGAPQTAAAPVVVNPDGTIASAPRPAAPAGQDPVTTAEQVAEVVRQTLAAEAADPAAPGEPDVSGLVQGRLEERIEADNDALRERLEARIAELETRLATQIAANRAAPAAGATVVVDDDDGVGGFSLTRVGARRLANVYPVVGFRRGEDQTQAQFGLRGEYRNPAGVGAVFVPEFTVGFADGVSLLVLGNLFFENERNFGQGLQPYYGVGGGLLTRDGLSGTGLALNLVIGAEYPLGPGDLIGEVSTLDLFQYSRVLFGYKFTFRR